MLYLNVGAVAVGVGVAAVNLLLLQLLDDAVECVCCWPLEVGGVEFVDEDCWWWWWFVVVGWGSHLPGVF